MRPRELAFAALVLAASPCYAQTADTPIDLDLQDADLGEAVSSIARKSGQNAVLMPTIRERVSVKLRQVAARNALRIVAELASCEVDESVEGVLLLVQRPKVVLRFKDADIRTLIELTAAYSGKSVVIAPEVRGRVAVDIEDVGWGNALRAIVENAGPYAVVEDAPGMMRVVPRERAQAISKPKAKLQAGRQSVSVDVQNADLRDIVKSVASQGGPRVQVDPRLKRRVSLRLSSAPSSSVLKILAILADARLGQTADGAWILKPVERWKLASRDADAAAVIARLSAQISRPIQLPAGFSGRVTVAITDVPWRQALRSIVAAVGAYRVVEEPSGAIRVIPR